MNKIRALSPWRNWYSEALQIKGGKRTCGATTAYIVDNVHIIDSFLYSGLALANIGPGKQRLLVPGNKNRKQIDEGNLVTTWSGSRWFGSLLLDDFPIELIPEDGANNIRLLGNIYSHEAGYRRLLGLDYSSLIRTARVRQMTIYDDATDSSYRAKRYDELRARVWNRFGKDAMISSRKIYLKRGATGEPRVLTNEMEVVCLLESMGFNIVEPENLSAEKIAELTVNAKIVVGIEGSHLSHAQYSIADDGALVVIQPPDRFSMVYKEFTDCLGIKFGFVVGNEGDGGFSVSLEDLRRVLDKVV